jgi:hypothetical protein
VLKIIAAFSDDWRRNSPDHEKSRTGTEDEAGSACGARNFMKTLRRSSAIPNNGKGFASLAMLMLVNQGKLSLDEPVRKLAPEVWFENRWESTDPVRVVHLLEHTTGWDEIRFRESAKQTPPTVGLREALD